MIISDLLRIFIVLGFLFVRRPEHVWLVYILALVQEALGQLRLDMKYLMFDLEATRRERDEFKQLWENR